MIIKDIRNAFLSYYKKHDHKVVPSASLVPENDPSLLFTSAGMVPFKDYFLQKAEPPHHSLVSSQKCLRAGGKHNDFENVGYTKRHNTFFEMLGNFSFGSYFKEKAIVLAWDFLIKELKVDPNKLSATYYYTDEEAFNLWTKFLPSSRITPIKTNDNFWSMGDQGPCGPCTEIFYDFSDMVPESVDEEDRIVEIWNLVFMQYNALNAETKVPLEKPCVDTGVGIERLACVLQGVSDNYETDILKNIKGSICDLFSCGITEKTNASFNVIADHIRSSVFLVGDGVFPENMGRGYVLRKILRRAMRYKHNMNVDVGLSALVPAVVDLMSDSFPALSEHKDLISETISQEEDRFSEILKQGMRVFEETKGQVVNGFFPAETCFELYDTYGFPLDISYELIRSSQLKINTTEVESLLLQQKETSKKGTKKEISEDRFVTKGLTKTEFVGYQSLEEKAKVLFLFDKNFKETSVLNKGEEGFVVTAVTPFYAESGGQVGDAGLLVGAGVSFVKDTQKKDDVFFHEVLVEKGQIHQNEEISLSVDKQNRASVSANHTATHLLHSALRSVFSKNVVQKGSFVSAKYLRFDFRLTQNISDEELAKIELLVNKKIFQNLEVSQKVCAVEEARNEGAVGLFGEKYGETVRVISVVSGDSKEFCGGCHVGQTGEVGLFKIISCQSVGADTKRIQAITGLELLEKVQNMFATLNSVKKKLGAKEHDILETLDQKLSKKKDQAEGLALQNKQEWRVKNVLLRALQFKGEDFEQMRKEADSLKKEKSSANLLWLESSSGKITLILAVSSDLADDFSAKKNIRPMGALLSGKEHGGGRDDFAQCGGQNKDCFEKLISCFKEMFS